MLTERDYCDYDTCVALKELGITDCSLQYYEKSCPNTLHRNLLQPLTIRTAEALGRVLAISLYNAQKWLREVKKLHITIYSQSQESWQYRITKPHQKLEDGLHGEDFNSFEEALSEGIKEAIEILKQDEYDTVGI